MQKAAIPFGLLLGYYLVVPLCFGIMLVDQLALGGRVLAWLPQTPYAYFWYAIFFNLPHIVCSTFMLLNKEYISHYRMPLGLIVTGAIALPLGGALAFKVFSIPPFEGFVFSIGLFAFVTLYHVFMQQLGINKLFARNGSMAFNVIAWSNILPGTAAYLLLFLYDHPLAQQYYPMLHGTAFWAGAACFMLALPFYRACWRKSQTNAGRYYLLANASLSVASLFAIYHEYWLFALVMPRIIHDLTAFTVYINHDHNRQLEHGTKAHPIYGPLGKLGVPAFILTPAIAIALAYPITQGYISIGWGLFFVLALIHYATESLVWKNGTPHRRYLAFKGVK